MIYGRLAWQHRGRVALVSRPYSQAGIVGMMPIPEHGYGRTAHQRREDRDADQALATALGQTIGR